MKIDKLQDFGKIGLWLLKKLLKKKVKKALKDKINDRLIDMLFDEAFDRLGLRKEDDILLYILRNIGS